MIDKPWLTVEDAASMRRSAQTRSTPLAKRGELRHVKVGGRKAIRLRTEWIDGWLETSCDWRARTEHSNLAAGVR
jgi:hypothetical protein